MRLLENLCCFIPSFSEIGDSLGGPSGQCLQGLTQGGSHQAAAQESFFFASLVWALRSFGKCLYILISLPFIFNYFFLPRQTMVLMQRIPHPPDMVETFSL
jgi:hypothetical protein